jgi:hypothetical protein
VHFRVGGRGGRLRLLPLASGGGFAEELPPSPKGTTGESGFRRGAGSNGVESIDAYEIGRGLVQNKAGALYKIIPCFRCVV